MLFSVSRPVVTSLLAVTLTQTVLMQSTWAQGQKPQNTNAGTAAKNQAQVKNAAATDGAQVRSEIQAVQPTPTKEEYSVLQVLLDEALKEVKQTVMEDFQVALTIDSKTPEIVQTDLFTIGGMFKFGRNISAPLIEPTEENGNIPQTSKVWPTIDLATQNLWLKIGYYQDPNGTTVSARFLECKTEKNCIPGQLVGKVLTETTNSLLVVRLKSLNLTRGPQTGPLGEQAINGTCESSRDLLDQKDFIVKPFEAKCRFYGTYSEANGYKLKFEYVNK